MTLELADSQLICRQAYIAGEWCGADEGGSIDVINPASGETISTVPNMGAAEATRAVEAAYAAWPDWRKRPAKERAQILRAWYELITAAGEDLARLMTGEQGKPLKESRGEVAYGASFVEWFSEEAKRAYGDVIPAPGPDRRIVVTKEPIGVVGAITPWNFPVAMITRKVAPALAAGCPVVLKPAAETPLCALALALLAERAGLPKGLFSVVTCASENSSTVGKVLTTHPLIRKISFTGSTAVGKILLKQAADTVKKASMELGGNAPFIIFDDADLDAAVQGVMASKYRNTGQTCICANRIFVQTGIYDRFADKLAEAAQSLKVGSGFEEGVEQGPLINQAALEKVEAHVADALAKGGRVVTGGRRHPLGGTFYEPTVLANVTRQMQLADEETFGPVAPLFRFETEEEVIKAANDTPFGLAAYFYSRDVGRVWRVAEGLESGMVGINTGLISTELAPFGGVKESGIGREGSKYGLDEYLEAKYLCLGGLQS